jgi:hypothetical protein
VRPSSRLHREQEVKRLLCEPEVEGPTHYLGLRGSCALADALDEVQMEVTQHEGEFLWERAWWSLIVTGDGFEDDGVWEC